MKKLREEGFQVGRCRVRRLMRKLGLVVKQRLAYEVITKIKHSGKHFNALRKNEVWSGDVTYLKRAGGWMYLAIMMDLYSRRIVGWNIDRSITTDLINKALIKAYTLRKIWINGHFYYGIATNAKCSQKLTSFAKNC